MRVQRYSELTGVLHTMELDITVEQLEKFKAGEKVQNVFPNLSAAEREFILSGITPEEWDKYLRIPNED